MALYRWLGLDRNPLRRRADRIETIVIVLLTALFLGCAAPLATLVNRLADAEQSWRQVTAVSLQGTRPPSAVTGWLTSSWVAASWQPRSGDAVVIQVPVPAGTPAGTSVRVWTNGQGQIVGSRPRQSPPDLPLMMAAEAAAFASLALGLVIVAALVRWMLNRRRMRAWTTAWTTVGPYWTARR